MGRVRILAKVDEKTVRDVVAGLKYVSSIPFISKAFGVEKIKRRVQSYFSSIFPVSSRARNIHLASGFRFYDVPGMKEKVAFVFQHANIRNERIRTILSSLEEGSKGYYRYPEFTWNEGNSTGASAGRATGRKVGKMSFTPGDRRGDRNPHNEAPESDFATVARVHIPPREGKHYMQRTVEFTEGLIEGAKPEFFRQVKAAVKRS